MEWQPAEGAHKAVAAQERRARKMGYAPLEPMPDVGAASAHEATDTAASSSNSAS
jgi:hypothetical protein